MKKLSLFILATAFLFAAGNVFAAYPTLSLQSAGDGNNVQLNVNGDPNTSVILFFTKTNVGSQMVSLGTTNSSGNFSNSIDSSALGIASGSLVYVRTNGINGPQSNSVPWPVISSSSGNFSFNQSALLLTVNQTGSVTASNFSGSLYLSNNSNPQIANININGNQVTVLANNIGSTTATICATGGSASCQGIYITVSSTALVQLTFSQNNITIASGQSIPISITGGNGVFLIQNNSNPGVISATINGANVNLSTSSTSGQSSITICSTNMSACGILSVRVGTGTSSIISFSQTNPTLSIGQSLPISISGSSGNVYYVSSNSNSAIVQTTISGNTLTLVGNNNGTASVTVCSSTGTCGTLNVTVSYTSNGGPLTLSQNTITVMNNQSLTVVVSGGTAPYNLVNPSPNIAQVSLNGNILTVYGVSSGAETVQVCSAEGGCISLFVIINGNGSSSQLYFSQNNFYMSVGQTTTITIYGIGNYYVSNNSNPSVANVQISGSNAIIYGQQSGSDNVSICQSNGQCSTLFINVGSSQNASITISNQNQTAILGNSVSFSVTPSGFTNPSYVLSDPFSGTTITNSNINSSGYFTWTPQSRDVGTHSIVVYASDSYGHSATATVQISVNQNTNQNQQNQVTYYNFTRYLGYGDTGDDVLQLQNLLLAQGYFTSNPVGHYGPATVAAIKKFQKANGITQTGGVGPLTRQALNRIPISGTSYNVLKQQQITTIQQAILQLQAQLQAMLAQQH
jgi:hypothetical protein